MAPIDVQSWSSNTGRKRAPPSVDFHTPPLAPPTQIVVGSPGTDATAPMRPLIAAGPMLRARRPASSAASSAGGAGGGAAGGGICANADAASAQAKDTMREGGSDSEPMRGLMLPRCAPGGQESAPRR